MKAYIRSLTSLLFAVPTFWGGFGCALDFLGVMNECNASTTAETADYLALKSDWMTVGFDLRESISQFQYEQEKTPV
jgi:hypothetical protein